MEITIYEKEVSIVSERDRREFRRLQSVHLVNYTLIDDDGKEIGRGVSKSLDISSGGMRIEVGENIPLNTKVEIAVAIKDVVNHFKGEIVHMAPLDGQGKYGAGIKVVI